MGARQGSVRRPPWWTVVSSACAPVALIGGWIVAELLQPPGYDPVRMSISALARHGAAHRWVMTTGLCAVGVCHIVTAAGLRGVRPWSRALLALGGVAGLGVGICAQPPYGSSNAHLTFAVLGIAILAVWPLTVVSRTAVRFPLRPRDAVLSAALSAVLLAWLLRATGGSTLGVAERAVTAQEELWPLLVVLGLRRSALRAPARDPVLQGAGGDCRGRPADRMAE